MNKVKKIVSLILLAQIFGLINPVIADEDVLFIGHAYGTHGGGVIPYPPLEKFLNKNTLPNIRIWGGDLTENARRFPEFKQYIDTLGGVNLLVRGNYDGRNLWSKTPYWTDYVTPNNIWIHNLDMSEDMKFEGLPSGPSIIASHYAYFNELFKPYNIPNSMYGIEDRDLSQDDLKMQKVRVLIAGDCGAFRSLTAGFAQTEIGQNKFVCTGMGGGRGFDNVVIVTKKGEINPIFFDSYGQVLQKTCKLLKANSPYSNTIKICSAI